MDPPNRALQIDDLKAGDHVCWIYDTEEEHRFLLTPYIRNGLEAGEKVIYITDAHNAETVVDYLREDGLELEPYLEKKQIALLTSADTYLREGVFDPDSMIALLRAETQLALEQGFSALRVTGEMSWALRGLPGSERLIEYEAKLNEFFPVNPCLALCQYDKRRSSPELLQSVLYTHPIAVIGTEFFDNLYYIAPTDLLGGNLEQGKLDNYLKNLARYKISAEKLRKSLDKVGQNEDELQRIFECVANGVVVTDLQGDITELNEQAVQMHGSGPKKNLIGKSVLAFIAFRDQEKAATRMQELAQKGITATDEFTLVRADGSEFQAEISAGLLKDTGGNPAGFVSVIRDITERKRTEKALKDSENRYRDLVENALVGVYQTNIKGEVIYANNYLARVFNESIEEFKLKKVQERYKNPKDREHLIGLLRKHGQVDHFRCDLVNAEGGEINVMISAKLDGDVMSGMIMNVTESKKTTEKLRRNENEIRVITENVPALISYVDADGIYRYVNKMYEDWFGIARSEIIGKHYRQVLGEVVYNRIRKHIQEALAGRPVHFEDNLPYKHGGARWVMANYLPDTDEQGRVRGFFALATDITALKQTEHALGMRLKELICLYQVLRAMQEHLSIEWLCDRIVRQLTSAMQFPEITVPVIELGGRRFAGEHYRDGLSPSLSAEITTSGETYGHIEIYYTDDKPFLIPEEQQLLDIVADSLGVWFVNTRATEALGQSERNLAKAQEIGHLGSWEWDIKNRTLTWSDELFRIFGVKRGEFIPSFDGIEAMIHPDDRAENAEKVKQMLSTAESVAYHFRIIRPDGEIRHIQQTGEISRDTDGKVDTIFGIMQDITEHRRVEDELRSSQEKLRHLAAHQLSAREEERTSIARAIHDDLGQALTALKMDLAWLRKRSPEDKKTYLEKLQSMTSFINTTILTVRRIATNLRPGLLDDIGLVAAIEWQVEEFQKRTEIKTDVAVRTNNVGLTEEKRTAIFRIFQETLTNVARHADASRVSICLRKRAQSLELEVRDNGRGITEEQIADHHALGIMGIRERVRMMGGKVQINGAPDKGTKVLVTIPL